MIRNRQGRHLVIFALGALLGAGLSWRLEAFWSACYLALGACLIHMALHAMARAGKKP